MEAFLSRLMQTQIADHIPEKWNFPRKPPKRHERDECPTIKIENCTMRDAAPISPAGSLGSGQIIPAGQGCPPHLYHRIERL